MRAFSRFWNVLGDDERGSAPGAVLGGVEAL
jgi:hypothetical protein